jgi:hypothetical protein
MKIVDSKKDLTHSIKLLLATVTLLTLLLSPSAFALQKEYFPVPGDYGLEFLEPNGRTQYMDVTAAEGGILVSQDFKRIENWQTPVEQTQAPLAIQLKCRRVGDAITVELSLLFSPTQESSRQGVVFHTPPSEGFPGKLIGSYSARLGESMELKELATYGIEPFSLKVVPANARRGSPSEIVNRTKAIEVVRVDKAKTYYLITVKNVSSKKVLVSNIEGGKVGRQGIEGFKLYIAPGEVIDVEANLFNYGFDPQNVPDGPLFVIADVVFEDLTYEGRKETAIRVAAKRQGKKLQWSRIDELLQTAIETYKQNSQKALATLRQQLSELSTEAENQVIEKVAGHFLPLSERERKVLIHELMCSLRDERDYMFSLLNYWEVEKSKSNRDWFQTLKDMCKAYLNQL